MNPSRIILSGLAILAFVACSTWSVADDSPDVDALFQRLDKNGDGKVTAAEIPEDQTRFFERLLRRAKKEPTGELTLEEFRQASKPEDRPAVNLGGPDPAQARVEARDRFERLDRNKDGKLTLDEVPEQFQDRVKPLFERSGKQELTLDEFTRLTAGRPDPAEMFARLDTNSDGKLTVEEAPERARPMIENALKQAGKDKNGSLTKDEFVKNFPGANARAADAGSRREGDRPAMERPADGTRESARAREGRPDGMAQEGRGPLLLRLLDTNHDGYVSKEEFAKVVELFEQLDRNHDGQLGPLELVGPPADGDGRRAGTSQGGMRRPESDSPNASRERPQSERNPAALFERLDRDGDGKISKDEAPEAMKERFTALDTNGDGFVTRDELRAGARAGGGNRNQATPERSRPE